ncbi:irregular chiasm C-roughest protein isoform X2 [Nilaparvata lugens]|uniref:irregular chiasm C-roughest protein isoform X2 n=1 Tax=Nilaparvata lugens TaxID=108931 RepID=UPI00193E86F9|nr:irregular chiasm C-roughest protein isoform X2 [Nilaparvata lugens]
MANIFSISFNLASCLLVISSIFNQGADCLQRFDKQPVYSEVNPGEDIKLDCKIFNKKGSCSWQKDNKPVGIYLKKYEWAGSESDGDCSLWVRAATLEFDDGEWECQVTASDFTTQDALTSTPIRLVVRVAPQRPRIEFRSAQLLPGHNVTARAGERAAVKCVSRYGNPPARIKWFVGDEDVTSASRQSDAPETDNPKTAAAASLLEILLDKDRHGQTLRCVALHESYPTKSLGVEARLDVTYPPEVRLIGAPVGDLEEGQPVVLRCVTDANPPASVVWRRAGRTDIASLEESLQFRPVTRRDSATYTCQAKNTLGASEPITVYLDVKYPPQIKSVGKDRLTTATLFSEVAFECDADANPTPTFQWLQRVGSDAVLVRSRESRLVIANATYEHQGEYVCRVTNVIAGQERPVQSEAITIQVVGAPQVVREEMEVVAARGSDATLRMVVCADPRPNTASWEWGSLQLKAGEGIGKYQAEELKQEGREDCYEARLYVREVEPSDSRSYFLLVKNERGIDKHWVRLVVREPISMMTLVSAASGCLLVFILCVLCAVYCVRTEKCCFSRRGDFKPTDLESEKSDIDSMTGRKTPRIEASVLHGQHNGPGEAMYCSTPTRRLAPPHPHPHLITGGGSGSPEAMKNHHQQQLLHHQQLQQQLHSQYELQNHFPRRASGGAGGGRSSSKKRHRERDRERERAPKDTNVFAELQVPSVSNNGSTMSMSVSGSLPHRMNYYNKSFTTPLGLGPNPGTYFTPYPSQQLTFRPPPVHNQEETTRRSNSSMQLRASHHYQPHSFDKAEI